MLWTTIISAFAPAAVEGIKQLIVRFTGGVRATTVAEQLQLDNADIERLKAIAALDKVEGNPSQWVVDLRASARYVGALVTILCGIGVLFIPEIDLTVKVIAMEAASVCFGFLFGQRIMVNLQGKK